MNLTDIARAAGVSVSTVSKAFSGSADIGNDTRERVFAAAKTLGVFDRYNKNKFEKHVVAVIIPELVSEYYSRRLTLLTREIEAAGGIVLTSIADFDKEKEHELFTYYADYCHVDGIILLQSMTDHENSGHTPAVAFSERAWKHIDSISCDLQSAITDAVHHLKTLGHTHIGFASEPLTASKAELFKRAMRGAGLPIPSHAVQVSSARFEAAGAEIVRRWLDKNTLPTAILAAYDYIAIGIIKELTRAGLSVPGDVSVIGMDDISLNPYLETSLSSIATESEQACLKAVALLLKKMDNQYYRTRERIVIPATFIPRESTGKVKER
ncbi:MAG: LacI family DNA-binding transcriptional regulator [Clostridia bacterium]|nr:LacI family DNA-binding transcriptional regulator [Clostridia bacterium]